jgi:Xaa-Pro aminopeptidase
MKDLLDTALVAEPSNLIHHLKQVRSPREIALIRDTAPIADTAMSVCIANAAGERTELENAASVYISLLSQRSSLPGPAR